MILVIADTTFDWIVFEEANDTDSILRS